MKKPRNTKTRYETSIVDGKLYFEDVQQAVLGSTLFTEIIEDKHTRSIRVVSLANDWYQNVWLSEIGFVKEDLNVEFTLRKEIVHGSQHWYAYRRVFGKLYKRYVGQSDKVTTRRLVEIAKAMPSL